MKALRVVLILLALLGLSSKEAKAAPSSNTTVDLVFTLALSSDAPYREAGVRLEISKEWANDYFLEVSPYIWGGYASVASVGGLIVRSGYFNGDWGVNFLHESVHNFDREAIGGGMGFDALEFRVRF